jgi:hypothetical protein
MNTDIVTETSVLSAPSLNGTTDMTTPSVSTGINWSTIIRYFLIFLILAFLGFNIFTYLGKSTEYVVNLFKPIFGFFGYSVAETAKQTIDVTAKGTTDIVNVAAGTASSGINLLENTLAGKMRKEKLSTTNALKNATKIADSPQPDDAGSKTQSSKTKSKSGYCYIGEDRGFRSCIAVGEGDMCMSGDIFPTMETCINPNLR